MAHASAATPRSRWYRRPGVAGGIALAAVFVLVLAVVLFAALGSWDWLKGPIERRMSEATGRSFEIRGPLRGRIGLRLQLEAEDVRLGNPDWATRDAMGIADTVRVEVAWWPLLRGRLDVHGLELYQPRLSLERHEDGLANWEFPGDGGGRWQVRELLVEEGRLELREPLLETDLRLRVRSGARREADARLPLLVRGEGRYRGVPFDVAGGVESPLELKDEERPYRVALRASAGATRARARGMLHSHLDLRSFDLRLALEGEDLADLYPLLGIVLPMTAPYRFDGQLLRDGGLWTYSDFMGQVGESDLAGEAQVDVRSDRTRFTAELGMEQLDFADLSGFVGLAPGTAAQLRAQTGRLFPGEAFDLQRIREMDADVRIRARSIRDAPLPIDSLRGHLVLERGHARMDPLEFGVAGGDAGGVLEIDARGDAVSGHLQLVLRGLQLGALLPDAPDDGTRGRIGGRIDLRGTGASPAAIAAGAAGEVELAMGRGRVGPARLESLNLDGFLARRALGISDGELALRCGFAAFDSSDGVLSARSLGVDTARVMIVGEGDIDLGRERLDLRIETRPKSAGLAMRAPVQIRGTLLDPEVDVDAGPLALRGVAAAVLYSIAPPAALLALVEGGSGEDADC